MLQDLIKNLCKVCSGRYIRLFSGYICAVTVGLAGVFITLELEEAIQLRRAPGIMLIFPARLFEMAGVMLHGLPVALLLAAPFTVLVSLVIIRYQAWQWQVFAITGACCPFFGIVLLQLVTGNRFFVRDIYTLSLVLIPAGIVAALVYRAIGFRCMILPEGEPVAVLKEK